MRHVHVKLVITATAALAALTAGCGGSGPSSGSTTASESQPLATASDVHVAQASCQATIDQLLAAPISPPNLFLNMDLSLKKSEDGGLGTGGLTIEQSGLEACAQWVEPLVPTDGPADPGFRGVGIASTYTGRSKTDNPSDPIYVSYNEESEVLGQVVLSGPSYTGTLAFHSRAGGAYGSHTYLLGLTPEAGSSVAGYVMRDGADFPADWTTTAWINEIYDGILASYAPNEPPAATGDCTTSYYTSDILGTNQTSSACLYIQNDGLGNAYLGVRPLSFYMMFAAGTNHAETVYEDWRGGFPSCATPQAAIERMDWSQITYSIVGGQLGPWIGDLQVNGAYTNPAGMLFSEANAIEGCGGFSVAAEDPGYSAMAWGGGEVAVEYNPTTGVAYKVIATGGYKSSWSFNAVESDGGLGSLYVISPTSMTLAGAAVTIDWSSLKSATRDVTVISNAWLESEFGIAGDADCRTAHDCEVVLDDGQGHSSFTVGLSKRLLGEKSSGFTVVFPQGTSTPVAIEAVNPGGEL